MALLRIAATLGLVLVGMASATPESSTKRLLVANTAARNLQATAKHLLQENVVLMQQQQKQVQKGWDVCHAVQDYLGTASGIGQDVVTSCVCQGDLMDTISMDCNFDHVCDDSGVCSDIEVNATLSHLFGSDTMMSIETCVDSDDPTLEKLCFGLDFAKPHFFTPDSCTATYGGRDCDCTVNGWQIDVNCPDFPPSSYTLEGLDDGSSHDAMTIVLPVLQDLSLNEEYDASSKKRSLRGNHA